MMFKVGDIVTGYGETWKVKALGQYVGGDRHPEYMVLICARTGREAHGRMDAFKLVSSDGKVPKYKPYSPEVFIYKNGSEYSVLDPVTGAHLEDVDDIMMFNCTFKKKHGHRGILGIPSVRYNQYIANLVNSKYYRELYYKSSKFIKPHFKDMPTGQPDKVQIVYIKDNIIRFQGGGFADDYTIKAYLETKLVTPKSRSLIESNEPDEDDE